MILLMVQMDLTTISWGRDVARLSVIFPVTFIQKILSEKFLF